MEASRRELLKYSAGLATLALFGRPGWAQDKPIRIGVLYDLSGPFAAAGSVAGSIGTQIAIDLVNEKGGVLGKHKVEPVNADSQSKAEVAINEAERLINQEKVDLLMGVFSSAHAVPLATKLDAQKKIFWINVAVASSVFKGKDLHHVFRAQIHSDQYGDATAAFIAENAKAKFGVEPRDVKIAIIHEDGPYGSGIGEANERASKAQGMQIVLKEAYSAAAPDLSSLVTKLKRARPDVVFHTGYNPDITLFLRQSREAGLRFKALVGHGAGYSQIDKLHETFGADVDYLLNADPVAAQLLDPKTLAPGLGELVKVMIERYKAKTGAQEVPTHCSMGFNQTWILLEKVLPVAITKYGGIDSEAIRKAALDVDIPAGGTIQGYGVKFFPPGTLMSGQNERSTPAVMQFVAGKTNVVWPASIKTQDAVLPLPASSPYALR